MSKQKVALVLSSGGARGIAHIGAIEEIERQGYEISSIAGCSMGAMVGAFYASGNLSKGKEFLCSLNERKKILQLADFAFSNKGFFKGERIIKELEKIISDLNIEDLPIPFTAVATNILDGNEIIFKNGNLLEAIRASISLPSIFEPLKKDNMLLIDGGIINPLPLNRIERTKGDLLIGVTVSGFKETEDSEGFLQRISSKKNKYNLYSLMMESITITIQQLICYSIEKYKPDILIQIPNREYGILQFNKFSEIIDNGIKATKTALAQFERSKESIN